MSIDLELQVRNLFDEIQVDQAPVTVDEVLELRLSSEPVQPMGARPHRPEFQRRRPWTATLGAAVAVLAMVGGFAILLEVSEADAPVATTAPIEFPPSPLSWSRVSEETISESQQRSLMDVAVGGPGLVAVGRGGLVWNSTDGITWFRNHVDGISPAMWSVTAGGPGLVAVGSEASHESGGFAQGVTGLSAAVWVSSDGITWSRIPHDEAAFGGEGFRWMTSVTVGGPGLVAVGTEWPAGEGPGQVWVSPDGLTWSRVPNDNGVFNGEGGQTMMSVTAGGPGVVAVGSSGSDAAVWTSPDGLTWSRVPNHRGVFNEALMHSVTVGGPGLVAVGSSGSGAAVWTSPDGLAWSRAPDDRGVFNVAVMHSVTVGGPGLVAVGSSGSGAAVWTSPDGLAWSRVPDAPGFGREVMHSVTAGGPGLVAVGSVLDDPIGAVWVAATQE